ncbi:DUF4190 domain-containing protein [Radiobacillus deserti]|uniref:DUF4190 domain-containing protein n=1 Tax=Radiobacillus deserti TaxID=2594883 RepID=A0A516KJC1_9BACI|nr:DUF4190 domain-containing protein [Radiobacillus deserti]QDP41486.1 DUF4190 domain-containing protein [Radiobacillus deserti]
METIVSSRNGSIPSTLVILSIILPFIGLILSVVGIIVSRKSWKEEANGFIASGLICSIVGVVVQLFVSFYFLTSNS